MNDIARPDSAVPEGPRRRYLTIVFSDLSDSTRLGASMEAEHYAMMLTDLRQIAHDTLERFGGLIVRMQGDGLLAIFGHPETREDDARRAAEAVLALHAAVREMTWHDPASAGRQTLTMHSGIHSGLVLVDDGDMVRGRFELLGNAPNLAARLSDAAAADEILVSEETLGPEVSYFETSQRLFLTVKGRNEPLTAYRILGLAGRGGTAGRRRRNLLPFIGRDAALQTMAEQLDAVLTGQPGCVALVAAAGVGKTRLAEEFATGLEPAEWRVLRGYCEDALSAEPFQPFLQMLRDIVGLHHGLSTRRALERVDHVLFDIDPRLLTHRSVLLRALALHDPDAGEGKPRPLGADVLVQALRDVLTSLAARRPLVLSIDDWQWADEASRQTLAALRAQVDVPLFVLITARTLAAADAHLLRACVIALPPFTEEESVQTVQHLLPNVDPFEAAEIQRYSGGNALFIEELCHSLAQSDGSRTLGRPHGGAAWLDILIESRLARLPAAQIELLRAAAVIGNVVPTWLLEVITGCGEDHPLVRSLAELDFIFPGQRAQTLRFKHGITRDVIYDSVGLHQRSAMHLRIAQAIQQQGSGGGPDEALEALAYHYGAAGQAEQAARYAELAGDKAMAASALDRAKAQYRAALVALDQLSPSQERLLHWSALSQRLGLACVFDASRDDLAIFRRAVDLAQFSGQRQVQARAVYWLGYIHYALGESREAIEHCERALALASEVEDGPLAVQIRATLGQARASAADYEGALALLNEASGIKRHHRTGNRPAVGLAYTLACQAAVLGDRGEFAQAGECFDEALDALNDVLHEVGASIRGWRAAVLLWQGRWEEARRTAAEAYSIGAQVRSLFSFSMSRAAGGYASWMLDGSEASLQVVIDATAWLAPRGGGLFESFNHGWLSDGFVGMHRLGEARSHAARALQRGRRRDLLGGAMAARAMARMAAGAGDAARARHYLALATKVAQTRSSAHEVAGTRLCAAQIEWDLGCRSQARALLDQAVAGFESMDMRWHLDQARALDHLMA